MLTCYLSIFKLYFCSLFNKRNKVFSKQKQKQKRDKKIKSSLRVLSLKNKFNRHKLCDQIVFFIQNAKRKSYQMPKYALIKAMV